MMKKLSFLILMIIACVSNVVAESYIGFELSQRETPREQMPKDTLFIFTLGGLNLNQEGKYYQMATWEVSYGIGSKTYQSINNQEYVENKLLMLGLNLPVTDSIYLKLGGGTLWSHTNTVNDNIVDKERTINIRVGAGYMLTDSITIHGSYHTGLENVSFGIGFLF